MQTDIVVRGMTCGHCAKSVTQELSKIVGVADVTVDVESGRVAIGSDGVLAAQDIAEAIHEAGYELVSA